MDRFIAYNGDPNSEEMFLRPSMAELVKRARDGETIVLLYPSYSKAKHAYSQMPQCTVSGDIKGVSHIDLSFLFWKGGMIRFKDTTSPAQLLSLNATFVFSKKAFFSASREMHRLAHERTMLANEK